MAASGPISDSELRSRRKAFSTLIMLILIVLFVLLCVYHGKIFASTTVHNVAVIDANLTRFERTAIPASSLFYNLSFTMSIQNTNSYNEAHYVDMRIDCYHGGQQFDSVRAQDFSIEQGLTLLLNISTSGNLTVDTPQPIGRDEVVDMEIWLSGKQLVQVYSYRVHVTYLSYQCKLSLPLHTSNANGTYPKFEPVYCR